MEKQKILVQINSVCNGSTGKIMSSIAQRCEEAGFKTYCFFGRGEGKKEGRDEKFCSKASVYLHALIARAGYNGQGSFVSSKNLVKRLREINPDIIHLHNIHGYYLNIKVLFDYLKNEYQGKIIWTLHDCWSFSGHCAYFTFVNCDKWKKGCANCPQLNTYPVELFDTTKKEYELKKKLFTGLKNMTIIVPSNWLAELVKLSYLKDYEVKVINNGIDDEVFKKHKQDQLTDIYAKYSIPLDKKIILGVANVWDERKGLKDFVELSRVISDDYQIVLVGVDEKNEKDLPKNIIKIRRTDNQDELSKLYDISYALFNPTYEDNYPTVDLEAIACGTPVIGYDVGGVKETIGESGILTNKKAFFASSDEILEKIGEVETKEVKTIDEMVLDYLKVYNN